MAAAAVEKLKVRFLQSIAGLADPAPREVLDARYAQRRRTLESDERRRSPEYIDKVIEALKRGDRYGDVRRGFTMPFAYKQGDIASIPAEIARNWVASEICEFVGDAE
jgi:hypothetical protein